MTVRDALRLQREIPNMPDEKEPPRQKFASANSKGDQTTQQTFEKANIGVVYNRPVKPPVFTSDGGVPPWFERLRREYRTANPRTCSRCKQLTSDSLARDPADSERTTYSQKTTRGTPSPYYQWEKICYRKLGLLFSLTQPSSHRIIAITP